MGTDCTDSCKSYDHDHDGFHYQNLKKQKQNKKLSFLVIGDIYLYLKQHILTLISINL
jgi:hypothetical protein